MSETENNTKRKIDKYSVVDLFCGIGGLTHGFLLEQFNVAAGIDIDEECKFAYETNNKVPFVKKDVNQLDSKFLENNFYKNKKKILVGCAPCQPFSILNTKNNGKANPENSERWKLLYSFANLIQIIRPHIISMENVPLLNKFKKGEVFNDFLNVLKKEGYYISYRIVDAQYYGVPQRRKRLVLFASLYGEIEMIPELKSEDVKSVRDAIGDLPKLKQGELDKEDPLHRSRCLSELSLRRIKATPEGGGWRNWPTELVADCHKREGGKAFGSAYGRMSWGNVSPTITTYCIGYSNGRFGHPEQDRAISLREAAILQSFPKEYNFIDPDRIFSTGRIATQIGNAVPVLLGRAIASSIARHIEKFEDD
ncbi:DNA cytosine methyltransferase [Persicitalea jodogahamensis]|uniref:Cytosine-specific methyltransferase n=1 Tax=Persicitalea jodogahamensis TaxID=402147 RepID=A0A8J3GAW1_9BACT|nr:DNA cytosine methyltransferase [Persicitalea jodogahamensis]GHB83109.1 cytosine-specific methyltransferase [Persicitalea jodogahamensis]